MGNREVSMPMVIAAVVVVLVLLFGGYKLYDNNRQAKLRAEREANEKPAFMPPVPPGYGGGAR